MKLTLMTSQIPVVIANHQISQHLQVYCGEVFSYNIILQAILCILFMQLGEGKDVVHVVVACRRTVGNVITALISLNLVGEES